MKQEHTKLCLRLPAVRTSRTVVLATDASVEPRHVSSGYLSTSGHAGGRSHPYPMSISGKDRTTVAELRAVYYGLKAVIPDVGTKRVLVWTDSTAALGYLQKWSGGSMQLPASYSTQWRVSGSSGRPTLERLADLVETNRERLTFSHVKGHNDDPLNEGAHHMAYLAKQRRRGRLTQDTADRAARLAMETSLALYAEQAMKPGPAS